VLRETGDAAGARREYQRALTAAGGKPTLSMMVGLAHSAYAAGEHGEAIAAYRRVLGVDASLPRVRLRLAHALLRRDKKGDVADALEVLDAVPDAASDRTELALLRALAAARSGDRKKARATVDALSAARETHPDLMDELEAVLGRST
nr:tetratricopeptide repeat protein [Myxococcota bacterium]